MSTARWTGVAEAEAAIRGLGEAFSEPVFEAALKKVAAPMAEEIRAKLEAEHHLTGRTAENVHVSVSSEGRGLGQVLVFVGARTGRHGRASMLGWLEYGTSRQAATPVVRPVWDAHEGGYVAAVVRELHGSYERAVRRFARYARVHGRVP